MDVAAGVLNFDSDGLGHEMAEACLENLRKEFRGDDWGNNGPGVITRVLKNLCTTRQVSSTVQHSVIRICNWQCPEVLAQRELVSCVSLRFMSVLEHYFVRFLHLSWFLLSPLKLPVKVCLKLLRAEFVKRKSCG